MKNIIVKGKSEKTGFSMTIPQEELIAFLQMVIEKSAEEFDSELATSPGGLPTALFTCICPGKAREDAGWKMEDGKWAVMNDENNPISMGFGFLKPQSPQRKDTQRAQSFFAKNTKVWGVIVRRNNEAISNTSKYEIASLHSQ